MIFTFSLGQVVAFIGAVFVVFAAIASSVIWLYSTFITRTEAAKLELAVQGFIESFRQVMTEQLKGVHARLDSVSKKAKKVKHV